MRWQETSRAKTFSRRRSSIDFDPRARSINRQIAGYMHRIFRQRSAPSGVLVDG